MPRPPAGAPAAGRLDGVLVLDKPSGPTSHDIVAIVRRLVAPARVGHTGTLDPLATGVLPLVIGRATRLSRFLSAGPKTYRAEIRLGVATDTYDAQGTPVPLGLPHEGGRGGWPDVAAIEAALDAFRGTYEQVPPPFSAKKVGGTPAHRLARRERPVALRPVVVEVHRLVLLDAHGPRLTVEIGCSAGFYVRSLAHALGVALGCGAHLATLRRTRSGEFGEDVAHPIEALLAEPERAAERLIGIDRLLRWLPAAWLSPHGAARAVHGQALAEADVERWERDESAGPAGDPLHGAGGGLSRAAEGMVRLLAPGGRLLGLARQAGRTLQPAVVLI